jgi:hypothetical protein
LGDTFAISADIPEPSTIALLLPALLIGTPAPSRVSNLELYLIFPLTGEENTITLVRGTMATGGLVLLLLLAGPENVFSQIALFFSKMAVVTFGGAYAALAYVAQQAVDTYGWLGPGEMLDGLAMAAAAYLLMTWGDWRHGPPLEVWRGTGPTRADVMPSRIDELLLARSPLVWSTQVAGLFGSRFPSSYLQSLAPWSMELVRVSRATIGMLT